MTGFETVDRVLEVDQTPIGKTPRSCPRHLHWFLGHHSQALCRHTGGQRAATPPTASASTPVGACCAKLRRAGHSHHCHELFARCESAVRNLQGRARFNPETLAVTWRGKNIGDVLKMEVDEAVDFFAAMLNIAHPVQLLKDVGLGYLTPRPAVTHPSAAVRRSASNWSPNSAKCATTSPGAVKALHTLYVLDEPHGKSRTWPTWKSHQRPAPLGRRRPQRGRD